MQKQASGFGLFRGIGGIGGMASGGLYGLSQSQDVITAPFLGGAGAIGGSLAGQAVGHSLDRAPGAAVRGVKNIFTSKRAKEEAARKAAIAARDAKFYRAGRLGLLGLGLGGLGVYGKKMYDAYNQPKYPQYRGY